MPATVTPHFYNRSTAQYEPTECLDGAQAVYLAGEIAGERATLGGGNGQMSVVNANEDPKILVANTADQVVGSGGGAANDYLDHILLSVTAAATLVIKDGSTTLFTFAFGAAVATPISIPVRCLSQFGAWNITTGAGMTGLAFGVPT